MTAPHTPPARVPQLELLRVIATSGIFLFHLWMTIPLRPEASLFSPVLARIPLLGTVGVMLFNAMAGFVLALPHIGHPQPQVLPGSLRFFRRRFGRICPQYYLALLLWTIPWLFSSNHEPNGPSALLAFLSHALFVHTLQAQTFFSIVPAFWWLGMLAQFYLVYPWLQRFFVCFGPGRACVLACVLPWSAWAGLGFLAGQFPGGTLAMVHYLSYFNLPVRLPEFVLGMWLASAWNRNVPWLHRHSPHTTPSLLRQLLTPLLVSLLFILLLQETIIERLPPLLGHLYLVAWCMGSMLALLRSPLAARLGTVPLVVDVATASYSIYLLHQPLLGYANLALSPILNPPDRFVLLLIALGFVCYKAAVGLNLLVHAIFRRTSMQVG